MPVFRDADISADSPPCWGFADAEDPACRRCDLRESCIVTSSKKRPPCWGYHDPKHHACAICILESTCREVVKGGKKKRKKKAKKPYTLEDASNELSARLEKTLKASRYQGLSRKELIGLAKERGLSTKGRPAAIIARLERDDDKPKKKIVIRKKK